jgi:hypothetical protein
LRRRAVPSWLSFDVPFSIWPAPCAAIFGWSPCLQSTAHLLAGQWRKGSWAVRAASGGTLQRMAATCPAPHLEALGCTCRSQCLLGGQAGSLGLCSTSRSHFGVFRDRLFPFFDGSCLEQNFPLPWLIGWWLVGWGRGIGVRSQTSFAPKAQRGGGRPTQTPWHWRSD